MSHTLTDILVCAANDHIPKTALNTRIRMYWCNEPIIQAANRLQNRAIKRFRARKDDNNKQAMHKAGETYESACNFGQEHLMDQGDHRGQRLPNVQTAPDGGKSSDSWKQINSPQSTRTQNKNPTGSSRALSKDQLRHSYQMELYLVMWSSSQ